MVDHRKVYQCQADQYERLVLREDYQGNLLPALKRITSFEDRDIVELGAGTGRLTRLILPKARSVYALDISPHMLQTATEQLGRLRRDNWQVAVADHRRLPIGDDAADILMAGWSICYLMVWGGKDWRHEVSKAMGEMSRVVRPDGVLIILETLGTGHTQPYRSEKLRPYYEFLERNGFQSTWVRMDLRFDDVEEAEALMGFFFGEEMARWVVEERRVMIPECTGIWWRGQDHRDHRRRTR